MIPYNVGECRKHVMQQLRNAAIFAVRIATSTSFYTCVLCVVCLTVLSCSGTLRTKGVGR
jgi:hypothetical protein